MICLMKEGMRDVWVIKFDEVGGGDAQVQGTRVAEVPEDRRPTADSFLAYEEPTTEAEPVSPTIFSALVEPSSWPEIDTQPSELMDVAPNTEWDRPELSR